MGDLKDDEQQTRVVGDPVRDVRHECISPTCGVATSRHTDALFLLNPALLGSRDSWRIG